MNIPLITEEGIVTRWPKNQKQRAEILEHLASKFETGIIYHERDVNEILKTWHDFQYWPLLRRELVDRGYLTRNREGTEYRKVQTNL